MATSRSVIVSGFKEDCETLMTRFKNANDIRFETFCEIWKDMKFSLIFTGRETILELLEFCEEVLHICKQFLLLPQRFQERIGGLYLLYGVYYKMPIDQFKIRVKHDNWRSIMELHAEIKEAEHLDANYILCKLIADNAFHYCIFDREYGLEKPYRVKERQCFNPYSVLPTLKDLAEDDEVLAEINEFSKAYEEQKRAMMSKSKSKTGLNLYNAGMAAKMINDIETFVEHRKNQQMRDACDSKTGPAASTSKMGNKKTSQMSDKRKLSGRFQYILDTDVSDSDDEQIRLPDYNPNLPESFD